MINIARLSATERSDLFRNTASKMGLSDAVVEKDFWVCFTLDYFFTVPCGRIRSLLKAEPVCQRRFI